MKYKKFLAISAICALSSAAFAKVTPLVDVNWIKNNSCNDGVRVLDIRNPLDGGSKTDYLKGHIPCAVYTDYLKGGWRTKVKDVVGQLPPTPKLEKLIGDLGIDNNTHVVIYHHGKNALDLGSATRMYWTFKVLGHDDVSILNGGYLAYTKELGKDKKPVNKVERGNKRPSPKKFTASLRKDMLINADDVLNATKDSSTELVDLRPNHQHIGINKHGKAKRYGTIPTSKNLPESWLTKNGGGTFRGSTDVKKLFGLASLEDRGGKIHFCNTGHWASLGWFADSEILGNKEAKLYDGSMVEWTANKSLPMEKKVDF
jgi:thiosulfate/3-mercaptopyruvate sulfurtransferase